MFDFKGLLRWLFQLPTLSWAVSAPFPFLSSAAITQLWHLPHLRVSITIESTLFTASYRSLSRLPCRYSPATHLLLVAFQRMILQPLYLTAVKFCCRLELEPGPLQICIHFDLLMFFFVDYHILSFRRCLRHPVLLVTELAE